MSTLLSVTDLRVTTGRKELVSGISFSLDAGELLAIVGESGSGKSVSSMACCGLLPPELSAVGSVRFDGQELLYLGSAKWRTLRRNGMAAIFQDPMSSLNPLMKVSTQISEAMDGTTRLDASRLCAIGALMREVGLEPDNRILHAYPFELSGGQQQRIMIAMALATNPRLLIADEPTTALDASTQAQVIELLQTLRLRRNMAVLMVTHDLSIVRSTADRMAVFHEGRCVEQGTARQVMSSPQHPYTQSLVRASLETVRRTRSDCNVMNARSLVLDAQNVSFRYPEAKEDALKDICISVKPGECLGIVGASGSGKSTLAKVLVGALPEFSGKVDVCGISSQSRWQSNNINLAFARHCQYVFQDTTASLNPTHTVEKTLIDSLKLAGHDESRQILRNKAGELLLEVDLDSEMLTKLPLQLSGGQRQRIVIARALAMRPKVLVCDEPVSALDAHLQKQVVNLLVDLQQRHGMALVFIGHDLHLMSQFCDRLVVMDRGTIVESGVAEEMFTQPRSAALKELLGYSTTSVEANPGPSWDERPSRQANSGGPDSHSTRTSITAYLRSKPAVQTEAA